MAEDYRNPAAIGVAEHNGWAILVTIGIEVGEPTIIDRRRIELLDDGLPSQPYHHETLELGEAEAEQLVAQVKASAEQHAKQQIATLLEDLDLDAWNVAQLIIPEAPIEALPETVKEIHANQLALYAADGMIYHRALCSAAQASALRLGVYHKNDVLSIACDRLDCSPDELEEILLQFGKEVGSPWQKEHRLAAAAAIDSLM